MFICVVSIDILDDDFIYCINLSFNDVQTCQNIIDIINNDQYDSNFAKKCVTARLETEDENESTLFENHIDAKKYIENFFDKYCKFITHYKFDEFENLIKEYKAYKIYFT